MIRSFIAVALSMNAAADLILPKIGNISPTHQGAEDVLQPEEATSPEEKPHVHLQSWFDQSVETEDLNIETPLSDTQAHLASAMEHFRKAQWRDAQAEFIRADRLTPHQLPIIERIAVSAAMAGDNEVARAYFERYLKSKPGSIVHMAGLAEVLFRQGEPEPSLMWLDRILAQEPENFDAQLGKILVTAASKNSVECTYPWFGLSLPEAKMAAKRLLDEQSDLDVLVSPEVFQQLVDCVLGEGAGANLEKVAGMLAVLMDEISRQNQELTRKMIAALLDLGVRNQGLLSEMAKLHFLAGEQAEALAIMQSLAEQLPSKPMISYNYGLTLMATGQYGEAKEAFQNELSINPNYADARFALACAYAGSGQMEDAWPILVALAEEYPDRMPIWLEGDELYLVTIRNDPRFPGLQK